MFSDYDKSELGGGDSSRSRKLKSNNIEVPDNN